MMATDVPQILYLGLTWIKNPTLLNLITTLPEGIGIVTWLQAVYTYIWDN